MKKRIALSAVVALAGGLLAAAPASAAEGTITVPATSPYVGGYAVVTIEGAATTEYVISVAGGQAASASSSDAGDTISIIGNTAVAATFPATTFQFSTDSTAGAHTLTMNVVAATAGTTTISATKLSSGAPVAAYTKSFTWKSFVGASTVASAQWSTVGAWTINAGGYASAVTTNSAIAATAVTVKSTDDALLPGATARVVVSGPGTVTIDSTATTVSSRGRDITLAINSADSIFNVNLFGDGNSGTTTIKIYAGAVLLGEKSFIFYKDLKSLTVKQQRSIAPAGVTSASAASVLGSAWVAGSSSKAALVITGTDVDGNTFPVAAKCNGVTTAVSSDTTVMWETIYDTAVVTTAGTSVTTMAVDVQAADNAASGKSATLTLTCALTSEYTGLAYKVATTAIPFTTGGSTKSTTISFDKAAYGLGQNAVITVVGKDASGNPVHDDAQLTDGGLVSNLLSSGTIFGTADLVALGGKGSFDGEVFAPVAVGTWTVSGYDMAGKAISASTTVSPDSATAANAAAIATLQTSVAALQTTVASLVASLTAQIKVINSALAKIAKKLKVKI